MVSNTDRVAVSLGLLLQDLRESEEENRILREAVGEMQVVLEAAVETLGLDR